MANETRDPESVFKLVETVEAVTGAVKDVAVQADSQLADAQDRWRTAVRDAGVADERLRVTQCWALFHSAFAEDLRRLAGPESGLATIFEEKSRNLGRMIIAPMGKVAEAAGVLVPRDPSKPLEDPLAFMDEEQEAAEGEAGVGSTLTSLLDEEGIRGEVEARAEEKAAEPRLAGELLANVVKLMAKMGTRRNGLRAGWTVEEIEYGLRVIMPDVELGAIEAVLVKLKQIGVVEDFNSGKAGMRIYALRDDYIERLGWETPEESKPKDPGAERLEALQADLRSTLQSNRDASGNLLPWKLSSLFYALQDHHPWITRPVVAATASAEPHCRETAPQVYEWTEVKPESPQAPRRTMAPRWARECTPEEREAISNDPGFLAGSPPMAEAQIDEVTSAGLVGMADAIYKVLAHEASGGQRRIWKTYDIIGLLGRGAEFGVQVDDACLTQEGLESALTFLVTEDKLEVVPPSPERPWIKQPGWRVK